jgi:hypothetical protein
VSWSLILRVTIFQKGKELSMHEEIGNAAGLIWQALDGKGALSLAQLKPFAACPFLFPGPL